MRAMPPGPVASAPVLMSALSERAMLAAMTPAFAVIVLFSVTVIAPAAVILPELVRVLFVTVTSVPDVRVPVLVSVLPVTVTAPADAPARVVSEAKLTVN